MPYRSARRKFIDEVLKSNTDDCIYWPFAKRQGTEYGHYSIWFENRQCNFYVHNYVCRVVYGPPIDTFEAAHSCGNSLCINPRHLRWATHCDNMQDAVKHGRMKGRKSVGQAKGSAQ